jgi:hypothetical protein
MKRSFMLVMAALIASLGTLFGTSMTHPGKALADYGQGAQYQIELSYNCNNPCSLVPGTTGAGVWLWIELSANHTGDYQGSDCLHGSAAIADSGSVTWTDTAGHLVVSGLNLAGGALPPLVVVPDTYGHYRFAGYPVPGFPALGTTELQIAP